MFLASLYAFTACSDETLVQQTDEQEKTAISLSVGGVDGAAATRAVITDKDSRPFEKFPSGTNIYMVMKSQYVALPDPNGFAGDHTTKYSVTAGTADAEGKVNFVGNRIRYWDDIHARCSNLNIWAIACPGANPCFNGTSYDDTNIKFNTTTGLTPWQTTAITATSIEWNVPNAGSTEKHQTEATCKNRDLVFSNNLVDYTSASGTDRRLKFNVGTKKFNGGELVFYRAMSKITININIGDGFSGTGDFKFTGGGTDDKNIRLHYFNIWGKFNVESGEFTEVNKPYAGSTGHADICSMWNHSETPVVETDKPAYTLEALTLPYCSADTKTIKGSIFTNSTDDKAIEFYIDNSKYLVSRAQLLEALVDNGNSADTDGEIKMEAGKNYIFTFTVGKQKINKITAQVAEWEDVTADEFSPSNARIKLQLEERGSKIDTESEFSLYRSTSNYDETGINDNYTKYDWTTGFGTTSGLKTTPTYDTNHWTTSWFWESNKHFYHFRALGIADDSNPVKLAEPTTAISTSSDGDYIAINSAVNYKDLVWGAPMLDDGDNEVPSTTLKWSYDPTTYGFDGTNGATTHQIYKAIGPTEDQVKLILFHMMSDLTIKLQTTTGTEQVTLIDGDNKTKVELVGEYPKGKVLLGNGLVQVTGDPSTLDAKTNIAMSSTENVYKFGAVPQILTNVKLYITTPDNNQYIVDLKDIYASTVSNTNLVNPYSKGTGSNASKYLINRWYPGYKYIYTFTLKKTGITNITATIVNWETVTADPDDVYIK